MGFYRLSRREFDGLALGALGAAVLPSGLQGTAAGLKYRAPEASFFADCAFVCIDFQEEQRSKVTSISKEWEASGYTVADCQAAVDFCYDVAMPNARKVADGCRSLGLPMVFVHWGSLFKDGMDLEPRVRRAFVAGEGDDPAKWTPLASTTRPAERAGCRWLIRARATNSPTGCTTRNAWPRPTRFSRGCSRAA
ncbi:MAG: hypothetical protein NTZ09_18910 [Candidatus Hydrogenedentes bacterium]|nr:hypothetical protein [Candidatus Hydrogenedentota bacterium]